MTRKTMQSGCRADKLLGTVSKQVYCMMNKDKECAPPGYIRSIVLSVPGAKVI